MQVRIDVGIWRGHRKGAEVEVPDDDLTRLGLEQGHVSLLQPPAAEDPEPAQVVEFGQGDQSEAHGADEGRPEVSPAVVERAAEDPSPKKAAPRRRGGSK